MAHMKVDAWGFRNFRCFLRNVVLTPPTGIHRKVKKTKKKKTVLYLEKGNDDNLIPVL